MNLRPLEDNGTGRPRRPERAPRLTEGAIDKIRERIVSGAWGPGDRLPKESELAAELGLSRNSLREAVRALSQLRVLEIKQDNGTYVSSLEPDLLLESTHFISQLLLDETEKQLADEINALEQKTELKTTHISPVTLLDLENAQLGERAH